MTVFMFGKLNSNPGYLVWENNTDFCPCNKITLHLENIDKKRNKKKDWEFHHLKIAFIEILVSVFFLSVQIYNLLSPILSLPFLKSNTL